MKFGSGSGSGRGDSRKVRDEPVHRTLSNVVIQVLGPDHEHRVQHTASFGKTISLQVENISETLWCDSCQGKVSFPRVSDLMPCGDENEGICSWLLSRSSHYLDAISAEPFRREAKIFDMADAGPRKSYTLLTAGKITLRI